MEAAVKTLKANIDALKPVFDQVGISAEDAQKALAQGMAALKKQVNDSIQFQIDQITRPDFAKAEQDLTKVAADFVSNTKDAVASGADQSKVLQLALLQTGAAMQNLSDQDLRELGIKFLGIAGGAAIVDASFDRLLASGSAAATAMTSVAEVLGQMATASLNAANSVRTSIQGLLIGNLTTLSPRDQLAEAQRQFEAKPSGTTLNTVLGLAQPFFGGATQGYADFFSRDVGLLANAGADQFAASATAGLQNAGSGGGVTYNDVLAAVANARNLFLGSLPHFDKGTPRVPGAIGAPMLAVIHGGERITPANDNSGAAMLAKMDALIARVEALTGATVDGSNKVAGAVKPAPSIHSTRKLGALRG
jgi:hypothetical protein